MANEQERKQDPATESDISKAQSQQQPQAEAGQRPETGEAGQFETGQEGRQEFAQDQGGSPDEGLQGDTLAQQRTDIEGAARETPEGGETESGFVGSKGEQDTSSELVDEEDDQRKPGGE
jgi:hypothetical protein